ncbi:centrosomal protein 15 isoform X2 [Engystomops pustulosus]|uniref:centrosomal protein 15 isoform X2 n=1 Tax=Engystomops pustulosus TaxID=76066 RepID=UPI003AFB0A75
MSASSPREAELRALHEAVIAERNTCLEEMDTRDGLPEGHSQLSEAAHSRNQALLRDLREAEKSFKRSSNLGPNRNIVKLEEVNNEAFYRMTSNRDLENHEELIQNIGNNISLLK